MERPYNELIKHSAIYGLGQIFSRLASFALLPLYTSYLRPADYGRLAILDLTAGVMGILIGSGMASAVSRYHFEAGNDRERDEVWWTGQAFVLLIATSIVIVAWFFRSEISYLMLGEQKAQGEFYLTLVLGTVWLYSVGQLPVVYLRVQKRSTLLTVVSLSQLLINICLNIYLVAILRKGIPGVLLGNLIAGATSVIIVVVIFYRDRGEYMFRPVLFTKFLKFGCPLMVASILALVMHEADRYLLRVFLDIEQVGTYSVAYKISAAIQGMIHIPFSTIWLTSIYDIAQRVDSNEMYARVFQVYANVLMLVLLAVSLFAKPILSLMAAPAYAPAATLIPIICLGYLFFGMSEHFRVPALLHKRTDKLLPASYIAACINIAANLVLIPFLGSSGAAWATVLTFVLYSFISLYICRKLHRIDYPLVSTLLILLGMMTSYYVYYLVGTIDIAFWILNCIAVTIWLFWALVIFLMCTTPNLWAKAFQIQSNVQ